MNDSDWTEVEDELRDTKRVDRRVAAAERLHISASQKDVPRLMTLLRDTDFFVREAAAWPISDLVGPAALSELLAAYQLGLDDGQDNDGLTTTLVELVHANPAAAAEVLKQLVDSGDPTMRKNAVWLLEFL